MDRTYKAILHGDRVEWIDLPPPDTESLPIRISLDEPKASATREERRMILSDALQALVQTGGIASIPDPVE